MRWLWLAFAMLGAVSLVAVGCGESEGDDGATAGAAGQSASGAGQSASGAAGASSAGAGGAATGGTAGGVSGTSAGGSSGGSDGGDAGAASGGGASSLEDCNTQHVTCKALPPQCGSGQVPSVEGTCWGDCVKIERCACSAQDDCPDHDQYTCWGGRHCGPYVR